MRVVLVIAGIVLAALGGVIAYRSFFIGPHTAVIITDTSVREVTNTARTAGGLALLVAGASLALFAAFRRR
jgi:hypothetical protein